MNRRAFLILAILLIAFISALFFGGWLERGRLHSSDGPTAKNPSELGRLPTPAPVNAESTMQGGQPTTGGMGSNSVQKAEPTSVGDKTKLWADQKTVPIDFWGKVLDQNDRPVAGARVAIFIRDWRGLMTTGEARFRKHMLQTDALGLFAVNGESGDSLSVEAVEKEGYGLYPGAKRSFSYNGPPPVYWPVAQEPFVFRLWKKGQPEPLIRRDVSARIPSDGTPVVFDLVTGKSSTNMNFHGDMVVRLQRDPKGLNQKRGYEWEVTIQAIEGGIQMATNGSLYLAPDSGYQPSIRIHVLPDDEPWRASKDFSAFLHHRQGGVYSRVNFRAYAHSPTGQNSFGFEAFINPSGSRNLEDDPRLRIEARFESATSPGQSFAPSPPPVQRSPSNPFSTPMPPPPPGFQVLTNRATPFAPPILPRP